MSYYTTTQLSHNTWKIVEDDPFREYPFIYVRKGKALLVVIDTGTGNENLATYIQKEFNPEKLPILCVCTHVHFDHIGGCADFVEIGAEIAMGNAKKEYTENYAILSNAQQFGTVVRPFTVTRWLDDGELIYLDGESDKNDTLEVFHVPGHTPDSICLLDTENCRVFIGDLLYPYTGVNIEDPGKFKESLERILLMCVEKDIVEFDTLGSGLGSGASSGAETSVQTLAEVLGMTADDLSVHVDPEMLLSLCDGVVEQAVHLFLSDPSGAADLCPPTGSAPRLHGVRGGLTLACGHVEADLPISDVRDALALLSTVRSNNVTPSYVQDGVGEFSQGKFTFLLPLTKL